ncbi:hypothetical protein Tco_1219180 [Tanacetum coccineum]
MGCCLTSWSSKKQTALAISTTEAEYVSAKKACQQALWMKQALIDYDVRLDDVPIMCDNKGAIDLSKNPVQHSRTKHIEIRHHFLRDNVQKGHISIKKESLDTHQYYSFSLEEFAEILGVPCEGACVFTDKWALYELANGLPGDGPYQTFLPSLDDIITLVRVDREDMYVEHFGYDIMEMAEVDRNEEQTQNSIEYSDDDYNSSDCEEIKNVDFQTEGDESVVIKDISTSDPFLNKLCSAKIMFRGMRYETPQQLKLALANYGVANGYQLWYMKNDWREVLVYYGRNVEEGRCAGKKGNKDRVMPNKVRSDVKKKVVKKQIVKKKFVKKQTIKKTTVLDSREGNSQSTKWTKKQIQDFKKVVCPFRLYASWMSNEHSFQIKSLISEHKCCKNYNLGALCTRAKQLALFDNEGGRIEHYGKLYQYRQALLESNPGSTCRLDVDESANRSATFRRIYICFKGVKDGWLAGCRKMYPITWAVVKVKNADNWGWFLHLLHDDLSLNDGNGITIISDSHKIKQLDEGAYDYLIQRNPNSWSMAFFEMDRRCAAFENGISESFNRAILIPRHKPIITMLEEISLYIMQRLAAMNKVAFSLEDRITPSIRKRLEILKEKQREWNVFPSGFQELEIRKRDHSYGVNLQHKDLDLGVSHWYSQESWFNAYTGTKSGIGHSKNV